MSRERVHPRQARLGGNRRVGSGASSHGAPSFIEQVVASLRDHKVEGTCSSIQPGKVQA